MVLRKNSAQAFVNQGDKAVNSGHMNTKKLKSAIQRWGEYNVVTELKHAKPRMNRVQIPVVQFFWSFK